MAMLDVRVNLFGSIYLLLIVIDDIRSNKVAVFPNDHFQRKKYICVLIFNRLLAGDPRVFAIVTPLQLFCFINCDTRLSLSLKVIF